MNRAAVMAWLQSLSPETWTAIICGIIFVAIVVWDIVLATNKRRGDTISEVTLAASLRWPFFRTVLLLAIGVLVGHLFWPQTINCGC